MDLSELVGDWDIRSSTTTLQRPPGGWSSATVKVQGDPPGTTSQNVKVPITPDTSVEGDETFTLMLSGASGATVADGTGSGTVVDND